MTTQAPTSLNNSPSPQSLPQILIPFHSYKYFPHHLLDKKNSTLQSGHNARILFQKTNSKISLFFPFIKFAT